VVIVERNFPRSTITEAFISGTLSRYKALPTGQPFSNFATFVASTEGLRPRPGILPDREAGSINVFGKITVPFVEVPHSAKLLNGGRVVSGSLTHKDKLTTRTILE